MKRIASLALRLLPLPIREGLNAARQLGAQALLLTAEWKGGFATPGVIPVSELEGRVLKDFARALRSSDLTVAALELPDPIRGPERLDRIYALGVRSIDLLAALDGVTGVLSLEFSPGCGQESAVKELTQLGLNRGVRVAVRTTHGHWTDDSRAQELPDGAGLDLDLPELRRFGQAVTAVLEKYRGRILHLRCDDHDVRMTPPRPQGLMLPTKVRKAEPETLDELTIFLEHAGYEGAWSLTAVPPLAIGGDPKAAVQAALARLQK